MMVIDFNTFVTGGNGKLGCLCGKASTSHVCDGSTHSSGCVVMLWLPIFFEYYSSIIA